MGRQRKITVEQFREGIVWVLITTDVLGRGIDFKGVNVVINWDIPKNVPDYVHRVGRTGRAGRSGRAITYFEQEGIGMAKSISHLIQNAGGVAPEWLLNTSRKELMKLDGQRKHYKTGTTVDKKRQPILEKRKKKGGKPKDNQSNDEAQK